MKVTGGLGSWNTSGGHSNYRIVVSNTEKNPGGLRRLTVTQTPVKDHLLKMWKTLYKSGISNYKETRI